MSASLCGIIDCSSHGVDLTAPLGSYFGILEVDEESVGENTFQSGPFRNRILINYHMGGCQNYGPLWGSLL